MYFLFQVRRISFFFFLNINFFFFFGHTGSLQHAGWHRFSCPVACGILDPQSWIKPTLPALESKFLTTGPPRKPPRISEFVFSRVCLLVFQEDCSNLPVERSCSLFPSPSLPPSPLPPPSPVDDLCEGLQGTCLPV